MKNQIVTTAGVRQMAWSLLLIFCYGLLKPSLVIAGGGGPTQPEVQGFTPIGVSDMVDPFTGDFTYNIPLMDVEGYPINIAYNSGITMDQEASWVGLGWNLNMGAIVRSMRGLPDDFDGDLVYKEETQKPREEFGMNLGSNFEIFGKTKHTGDNDTMVTPPSMSVGVNLTHSNYTGYGVGLDFGPSFSLKAINLPAFTTNMTFSGSSENGAGFSPSISHAHDTKWKDEVNRKMTNSVSGGLNSRAGLTHLAYGMSFQARETKNNEKKKDASYSPLSSSYTVGLQTYSPYSQASFKSHSITGRISWTVSYSAADVQFSASIFYNKSEIQNKQRYNLAYGYFNLDKGVSNETALLDFNRDNDGTFTKYSKNLPSAFLTNDIFSIQAQGISGSYRAYRNEIGYVFDPLSESHSTSGSIGFELGGPAVADLSVDLTGSIVDSRSGAWSGGTNRASYVVGFEGAQGLQESDAFQEANEKSVDTDNLFGTQFSKTNAEHFLLEGPDFRPKLSAESEYGDITSNNRNERLKRNQLLTFLSIKEVQDGFGLFDYTGVYTGAQPHHIGEMTQLGTDGRRYVFGIPAYCYVQEDATFSTGHNLKGEDGIFPTDDYSGVVNLGTDFENTASINNDHGIDEAFSSQTMPAYAHSFMLSAVLSDDYIDSDGDKGPTVNDQGSYVKFDYEKVENVRWRSPMGANTAYHNPGLKSDSTDDKSSFVYGEKEVWYVKAVETKNYIAVFEIKDRKDGISAASRKGGLNPSLGRTQCLTKISLYAKPDYDANGTNAVPIQEVHFVYDYSLCKNYPGNLVSSGPDNGKLTLKEIYFTYQNSYKLKRSSYRFEYNNPNADYNMKAVDRWGTYHPTGTGMIDYLAPDSKLSSADFPYTVQDSTLINSYCAQWTLSDIFLPSGGKIHVDYESDDYAYVQHKRASQMYPIVKTGDEDDNMNSGDTDQPELQPLSPKGEENANRAIFFKLKEGYNKFEDYFLPGQAVYFKCLVNMGDKDSDTLLEYVSGYAYVQEFSTAGEYGDYGKVILKPVKLLDNGSADYNPITKTAILFGRMNMPRTIMDVGDLDEEPGTNENSFGSFVDAAVNAGGSYKEYFTGPNKAVYDREKCQELVTQHSFIRLLEPTKRKYGGGLRVKSIKMFDNWAKMVDSDDPDNADNFTYGQQFEYKLEDGTSSGVASYEPLIGGDENSWKTAQSYQEEFMFAPDNELFLTNPIMESQFPNPSVGYSRVVITDLKHTGVTRTATGKVVKEFYTAKDFPTITTKTSVNKNNNSTSLKIETSFLPLLPKYDYLTASQGFMIETNDMHGKPKSEAVYAEGQTDPLSTVEYSYLADKLDDNGTSYYKLKNEVTTVNRAGGISTAEIGVKYDAVADFRESATSSIGVGPIELNGNAFMAGPALLVIPTVWSKIDISRSQFRSATLSKTVNRFGIMDSVTANQDGSIVSTANLAYDAETGDVLATQTTTNFNDKVYSLNYPAHWKYEGMGQAYKNIHYETGNYPIYADGFMPIVSADTYFVPGDELRVMNTNTGSVEPGWVAEVNSYGIRIIDEHGQPITLPAAEIRVTRSGRRNKQSTGIASVTTLENPLEGLETAVYPKVLNAGAVEFDENWKTYCDCFAEEVNPTTNPYLTGTKGNWRPVRSFTYLTDRLQTQYNGNTNIRKDGVFSSYSPYYYYSENNGEWRTNPANWTFVSKVTEFSPNGMTLETQDALGRYSSSLFGYNNTLTTAVAANSQLRQIAEGSFEDLDYSNCMDQGVFSKSYQTEVSKEESHTGRTSMHVAGGEYNTYGARDLECDNTVDCSIHVTPLTGNTFSVTGVIDSWSQNIISGVGTGSISFSGGVLTINYTPETYFEAEVVFMVKAGCKMKIRINSVLPDNESLSVQVLSTGQN